MTNHTLRTWLKGNSEASTEGRDHVYDLSLEEAVELAEKVDTETYEWSVREGDSCSGRLVRES